MCPENAQASAHFTFQAGRTITFSSAAPVKISASKNIYKINFRIFWSFWITQDEPTLHQHGDEWTPTEYSSFYAALSFAGNCIKPETDRKKIKIKNRQEEK